ncbi:MAG: MFS transporter [Pseudomonadota bacterium]
MFSSSFGQTFFISIFAGEIREAFDLSHGTWGGIYTIGTLASAALMLWAGGLADRIPPQRLGATIMVMLAVVCLCMALVPLAALLPLVIFGLRFCGQGMLSHIAIVSLGKWFARQRGRANSVISMGFLLGEACLPFLVVLLIGSIGWRSVWGLAAMVAVGCAVLLPILLRTTRTPSHPAEASTGEGLFGRHWTRAGALKHWLFWVTSIGLFAPPVFGTAYFFHQVHLVDVKGWDLQTYTAFMPAFTLASLACMILAGGFVDRKGSAPLMRFCLLPFSLALVLLANIDSLWVVPVGLALYGATQGMMITLSAALWPEIYGTEHLGKIRALASAMMVLGSAVGPGVTGALIDQGIGFESQMIGMAVYMIAVSIAYGFVFAWVGRQQLATAP